MRLYFLSFFFSIFLQSYYAHAWSKKSADSLLEAIQKADKKYDLDFIMDRYVSARSKQKELFEYLLAQTAGKKDLVLIHGHLHSQFAQYHFLREKRDIKSALSYYQKGEDFFRKQHLPCEATNLWLGLPDELTQANMDVALAEQILDDTYQKAEKEQCYETLALIEHKRGIYLGERQKNYKKSLEHMLKAVDILDKYPCSNAVQIEIYNSTGSLFYKASNYDKALYYWLEVDKLLKEVNYQDKYPISRLLNNIGLVYKNKQVYDQALTYYQKAIEKAQERKDSFWMNLPKGNIADILFLQKKYDTAYSLYKDYLANAYKYSDWGIIVAGHIKIANYFIETNQLAQAQKSLDSAQNILDNKKHVINTYNSILSFISQKNIFQAFGNLKQKEKKFEEAVLYQNKYIHLNDSINRLVNAQQLEILSTDLKLKQEVFEKKRSEESSKQKETIVLASLITTTLSLFLVALILFNRYKIQRQGLLLKKKNNEVALMNETLETQNRDIMDSILYAERIQKAFLPYPNRINKFLHHYFVLYKPKNVVSGDFYYIQEKKDLIFVVTADCTGHGVPGALMSMLGVILLDNIIQEKGVQSPSKIIELLDKGIIQTLHQKESESQDGMDISVCVWDKNTRKLQIAGAKTFVAILYDDDLEEIITDRLTVGGDGARYNQHIKDFTEIERTLPHPFMVYMFSDGYMDQFSSINRKKIGKKRMYEAFKTIHKFPLSSQKDYLENVLKDWQRSEEQIDDIMVLGIRF